MNRILSASIAALVASATPSPAQIEGLPSPAPAREMSFAKPQERTLDNGLRVIVVDRPGLPVVSAGLISKSGAEQDSPKLAGLAEFTAGLLMRGTTLRSAPQIAQDLEEVGAAMHTEAMWDGTAAFLTALAPNADRAFEVFADAVCHPAFAAEEVERLRKERIDEAQVELEQPGQIARLAAARVILGGNPYAHALKGTPASLSRIKREDAVAFHRLAFRPENCILIIAGDMRAESAIALAQTAFGAWGSEMAKPTVADSKHSDTPAPSSVLIDLPTAGQAAVYIGRPAPNRADPQYFTGQVTNAVLGGGYSARLNREIRIKRGLSYGAGSRLNAWRNAGIFGAACQTKNESAAEVVKVVRGELDRLGSEPVTEDELTARRLVLSGGFQRDLETNEGYVRRIMDFVLHGQPSDAFAQSLAGFRSVTAEEVKRFAAANFAPDHTSLVVVGRAKDCEQPLRALLPDLRVVPQTKVDFDEPSLIPPSQK